MRFTDDELIDLLDQVTVTLGHPPLLFADLLDRCDGKAAPPTSSLVPEL